MSRSWPRRLFIVVVGLILAGGASAAEEAKKTQAPPGGFYKKFFAPQADSQLHGEIAAAVEYVNPTANPWTRDRHTVSRVETDAIDAAKHAAKQYVIEALRVDTWSIPLFPHAEAGQDSLGTGSPAARLRFGISHMTPRAEISVPSVSGSFSFSADALGRVDAGFNTAGRNLSFRAGFDPRARSASASLACRF